MKICIHSDCHWSQNSSIVRSMGEKYSTRLENLINSVNWVERLAWDRGADCVICCGDFFDAAILNSMEISALQEIRWAPISHLFLTGNHETNVSSLEYSTTDLFKLCPNVAVINTPQQYFIDNTSVEFCFLPYITERDRKTIEEYFGKQTCRRVIFSHNDIKNVQYGSFLSTEGFEVDDIENNCNLYFNGHIHHCCNVTSKIINVGNLTGQNFTEDATKYKHCAIIFDTETLEVQFVENPYSLNFAKIDATGDKFVNSLPVKLNNAVLTIKVDSPEMARAAREACDSDSNVVTYRVILDSVIENNHVEEAVSFEAVDHLKQFEQYVLSEIGNTEIIQDELNRIMR